MKKVYTSLKGHALSVLFASSVLASTSVNAQCGNVVENFDNTGGSTAGFTGSFSYSAANGSLQRNNVLSTSTYSVTTPTYQLAANATTIGYGFTLGGSVTVSSYRVQIQYTSTLTGAVETIDVRQGSNNNGSLEFNPTYSGGEAAICESFSTTNLPGFPAGGKYRLIFYFDPASGSGLAGQTILFDQYRTNGTISQAPLPVTFIGFEARRINAMVLLTWQIAGEENVDRYEVERSEDGRSFTRIGQIQSHGKDTYTFTDDAPLANAYYRIRNVDKDGAFKYSTIARIAANSSALGLRAFPQPVASLLTLQHPAVEGKTLVSIATAEGRVVKSIQPASGSMQTAVDMSSLSKGMYFIRITGENGKTETLKIMKQ